MLVGYLSSFINLVSPRSIPKLLFSCSGMRIGISAILILHLLKRDVVVFYSWDLHEVILEPLQLLREPVPACEVKSQNSACCIEFSPSNSLFDVFRKLDKTVVYDRLQAFLWDSSSARSLADNLHTGEWHREALTDGCCFRAWSFKAWCKYRV